MTSSKLPDSTSASQERSSIHAEANEIDLLELFDVLWNGKKIIIVVTAFFTVGAIVYSLLQTEIYRAEVLLATAQNRESGSPLSAQLDGAAALVGINLRQTSGGQVNSILATLRSREFILKFIDENNLRTALVLGSSDEDDVPSDWQVYRAFSGIFSVRVDSDTGLIRMAIQWPDPVQAAEWVNLVVKAINAHEKARDVDEATNAIEYLKDQLGGTQLVDMQRVFYQLIESQTRVIMLADVRDEYIFRVIDPAVVPDQRIAPKRRVMVVIGIMLGMVLSILFVVFRHLIVDRKIFVRS